jgi:hypothetical protein
VVTENHREIVEPFPQMWTAIMRGSELRDGAELRSSDDQRLDYVGLGPTCKAGDLLVLNDHDVADLLKAAVKREGSQTAFAKRYDVDRSELNSILNGRRRISASLAKALGLRRVYIVEEGEKHSERLCSLAAS